MAPQHPGLPFDAPEEAPRFDGPAYEKQHDHARLGAQALRIWRAMRSIQWATLEELSRATGDPAASISAQIRHLRKPRFGSHTIERRHRGDRSRGLWEYRLVPNPQARLPEGGS